MKVSPGLGGRGVAVQMESKPHPDNHFEPDETRVKRLDDGTFSLRHEMKLKKKHEGKEGFHHSYREPITESASNEKEMTAKVMKHFGGKTAPKPAGTGDAEPDADDE